MGFSYGNRFFQKELRANRWSGRSGARFVELVGIVIAVISALFVLFHARIRQLSIWTAVGWAMGTFFLLIIVLPVYLLIHGPEPKRQDEDI